MAAITAELVKNLRETTGLPMMECKQALSENNGDFEAAKEWLRKKHKGKLEDRSDRATGEGRIAFFLSPDRKIGAIIELQCETAPVAKNELFVNLANAFAAKTATGSSPTPDVAALRADPALDKMFVETYGKLRETMNLRQARRVAGGCIATYIHHDGKTGVMIAMNAAPSADSVASDLCMHAAFAKPIAIEKDAVPAAEVQKIRELAKEAALAEGKPAAIVEKIAEGRVAAYLKEKVLMEQEHARADVYGKKTVRDVLKEAGVTAVTDMVLMRVGG